MSIKFMAIKASTLTNASNFTLPNILNFKVGSTDVPHSQLLRAFIQHYPQASQKTRYTLQSSQLGSSGFTFICSAPSNDFKEPLSEEDLFPVKFILKWVEDPINEKVGALFCRLCGFKAPTMVTVESKLAQKLASFAQKLPRSHSLESLSTVYSLVIMPRFKGITLSQSLQKGGLFNLKTEEWTKIGRFFGKIAVLDFTIGNYDRLFKMDFHAATSSFVMQSHSMNDGNVMLDLGRAGEERLEAIYCIDNGSSSKLCGKSEAKEASSSFLGMNLSSKNTAEPEDFFALFGEASSSLSTDRKKEPQEIGVEAPTPDVVHFHAAFRHFVLDAPHELGKQISQNMRFYISQQAPKELAEHAESLMKIFEKAVVEGIKKGCVKVLRLESHLPKLEALYTQDYKIVDLIKKNLALIKQHRQDLNA